MGTVVTIDLYNDGSPSTAELYDGIEAAVDLLHQADETLSTWKPDSALSRLRRGELARRDAPDLITEVLARCEVARRATRGWFNPWSMPGGVDPTGLVKGWAAQRSLDLLRHTGVAGALVNAAGDVASFGGPADGAAFRVGITDPTEPRRLAGVITTPGAVATSGTYERGNHLIDPHSRAHTTRAASATVVGPDLGLADAFATALCVAGPEGLSFVEETEDYEALIITFDGAWLTTAHFPLDERLAEGQ